MEGGRSRPPTRHRVIVIESCVAGLSAAHFLQQGHEANYTDGAPEVLVLDAGVGVRALGSHRVFSGAEVASALLLLTVSSGYSHREVQWAAFTEREQCLLRWRWAPETEIYYEDLSFSDPVEPDCIWPEGFGVFPKWLAEEEIGKTPHSSGRGCS